MTKRGTTSGPLPGWFDDPSGRHEIRYWDGRRWTRHVSDHGRRSVDPTAGAWDDLMRPDDYEEDGTGSL